MPEREMKVTCCNIVVFFISLYPGAAVFADTWTGSASELLPNTTLWGPDNQTPDQEQGTLGSSATALGASNITYSDWDVLHTGGTLFGSSSSNKTVTLTNGIWLMSGDAIINLMRSSSSPTTKANNLQLSGTQTLTTSSINNQISVNNLTADGNAQYFFNEGIIDVDNKMESLSSHNDTIAAFTIAGNTTISAQQLNLNGGYLDVKSNFTGSLSITTQSATYFQSLFADGKIYFESTYNSSNSNFSDWFTESSGTLTLLNKPV